MKIKHLIWIGILITSACSPVLSTSTIEINQEEINPPVVEDIAIEPLEQGINPNSLDALAQKQYGLGELRVEYAWQNKTEFTRYYITYDSDDLNIHGFVNIPLGDGPFPVVIALHGYIPASEYETLDYSTRYADSIARKGYIVLHPNMRNFPPSDYASRSGDYHGGFTTDVMNLLEYVRQEAGQEGSIFEKADLSRIGVWGHSLGGSVALRVTALVPEIKAVVLYAAVTQRYSNSSAGINVYDLENTDAAFSVHHGTADPKVRVGDSKRFCQQLELADKEFECFFYEGAPHTFLNLGNDDPLFIKRVVDFYESNLN
ncbi:MAG: dienelactone hydrolase family protein [Desulfobacterales bacterium]|nr:dienelactone hydrolase family protein [Desulfobacterales bacterium]